MVESFEAPTLEQLFLKLTELRYTEEFSDEKGKDPEFTRVPKYQPTFSKIPTLFVLYFFQFWALILKRFNHTRRDLKGLIIQYFLFLLMLVLTLWISTLSPFPANHGIVDFTPTIYQDISEPNQFVILSSGMRPVPPGYPTAESYLQTVVCPGGAGSTSWIHPRVPD